MGTSVRMFWILAAFFFIADAIYIVWSLTVSANPAGGVAPEIEWVGAAALGLVGMLWLLIAFYLQRVYRAQAGQQLPEDRMDANIDDGDAEVGHFSPWSWWPLILGVSVALVFLGIAIGAWIAYIGVAVAIVGIVGWVYEYYRGYFGH